jgi:hypothetical protein
MLLQLDSSIIFILYLLTKLVVLHYYISCNEDETIGELSDAFDSFHSISLQHMPSGLEISGADGCLFPRLKHAGNFRQHTEIPNKLTDIPWLPFLSVLVAEDNVNGSGHGPRRYFGGIFLHTQFLEIRELRSTDIELPDLHVAVAAKAFLGFSVFELLGDRLAVGAAHLASKNARNQFRTDFCGSCDCAFKTEQLPKFITTEITDTHLF